jgi:hypothetical protein
MKIVKRNYTILLLLAIIFACPGIAAYEFYNHPEWLKATALNKGELLNPPELLANINAKPKWRLILWNPGACELACREQVEKLARIRLALGRRLYLVDELLVMNNATPSLPKTFMKKLRDADIHLLLLSAEQRKKQALLTDKARIFIANPDDYLVLAYEVNGKSEDIFHDIGQLLHAAEKKSG